VDDKNLDKFKIALLVLHNTVLDTT
jgi:hypothetical protein